MYKFDKFQVNWINSKMIGLVLKDGTTNVVEDMLYKYWEIFLLQNNPEDLDLVHLIRWI